MLTMLIKEILIGLKCPMLFKRLGPDFYFGVTTTKSSFKNSKYNDIISTYNLHVAGNECKFYTLNSSEDFKTTPCDESLAYAKKFGVAYRGHNLFWPANSPSWFKTYSDDIEVTKKYILDYIVKVLDHYKDEESILYWDVINESVCDNSTINNIYLRTGSNNSNEFLGWDTYTEDIFKIAREHTNSNVKLFYNDFNAENNNGYFNGKTGAVYNYIKSMKSKDVPIDGVGLQMHISCNYYPNYKQLYSLISKYEDINVEVHVTEIDVSMKNCETHEQQRKLYLDVFKACFDHPNCKVFTVWGAYDTESWLGGEYVPLPFDSDMYPKDIYFDMLNYVLEKLPSDATYPTPTSTVRPTINNSNNYNYIIEPNTFIINANWDNWSWDYESFDFDDDGNAVIVLTEAKYGALSLHRKNGNVFNERFIHFKMKLNNSYPVKVIVHSTLNEWITLKTIENVEINKFEDYIIEVPFNEKNNYNKISIQNSNGKSITITINDFYTADEINEDSSSYPILESTEYYSTSEVHSTSRTISTSKTTTVIPKTTTIAMTTTSITTTTNSSTVVPPTTVQNQSPTEDPELQNGTNDIKRIHFVLITITFIINTILNI